MRVLERYDLPIIYGLKSGHVSSHNLTLPLGVKAELKANGNTAELNIIEPATL